MDIAPTDDERVEATKARAVPLDLIDPTESLCEWASIWPHNVLYIYTNEKGEQVDARTYGGLRTAASRISFFLLHKGSCVKGDRVLLVYPPGLDFITAFLGCLWGGLVPVPAYPPDPTKGASQVEALSLLARDADVRVALTDKSFYRVRDIYHYTHTQNIKAYHSAIHLNYRELDEIYL
jgi:acyl-CoA synthetase (AMP-forming)/AMP-acid ligase II